MISFRTHGSEYTADSWFTAVFNVRFDDSNIAAAASPFERDHLNEILNGPGHPHICTLNGVLNEILNEGRVLGLVQARW